MGHQTRSISVLHHPCRARRAAVNRVRRLNLRGDAHATVEVFPIRNGVEVHRLDQVEERAVLVTRDVTAQFEFERRT